ncbi:VOC family protein [Paracoccus denitrificans]|jgi:phospholipase/carboxylesterase|uniref:Glyoxalase/bleomycin resistance protein/dioxygenase n=1 Tax=Paracoccus denitrificans (strain Pd 1222) TaxID=318586 RepID=A1AYV1_PARDP|nr:VOC family protein [Paracoccus denitrificans]ABL68445.1 Glyoxalase/bleomycin resistance protein/dioxygenase [Paracoccus denitrificans PD1222]MBB4627966.1 phospholipase/carboxylesterase [Paracoccus denitrificans]MCU7428503.1 VOC family protein [Paracoccus denitrificans]QAR26519.1 ring-cleaving dioxygenase [Paracoccus denitrificans]UPV95458.1 VOC family protein [Paracoccus denitrificans]
MPTGIHHVTGITRRVQANVDFYAGFLGLRLVKRTGGFEDAEQLHLFYGDALGSPGSLVTFLVWEDGAPGRVGHGQVAEIALAVPPESIGDWLTRAMTARVPVEGPLRERGETVLRLKDPDGVTVKLVGVDLPATAPLPDPIAPTRLRGATILTEQPQATRDFLARFGYRPGAAEGAVQRMESDTDTVDIRDATGFFPGIPGTGILDHVAFRAPDADAVRRMRLELKDTDATTVHDRKYFLSLYVREPAGTLLEYATDAPGFTLDEAPEHLGETLFVPPHDAARADDLRVILPQFALPGEERSPMRELHFIHRFHRPESPDGSTIVLLHGTGGNESDLMPLAHRMAPNATLLGVRGRSTEEGINRWFRRHDAVTYDQDDIRAETEAFAGFIDEAARAYALDPGALTYLGYSNGANLLGAAMQLHPGLIGRAVLLRAVQVLEEPPALDAQALAGSRVLMLTGARDPFARMAPALERALRDGGAALEARVIEAGHELQPEDLTLAAGWLAHD